MDLHLLRVSLMLVFSPFYQTSSYDPARTSAGFIIQGLHLNGIFHLGHRRQSKPWARVCVILLAAIIEAEEVFERFPSLAELKLRFSDI